MIIPEIKNIDKISKSKLNDIVTVYTEEYNKYLKIIHELGGMCTYQQFFGLLKMFNLKKHKESYLKKRSLEIINEMIRLNLIKSYTLAKNYKYFVLRNFAYCIIFKDYKRYSNINFAKLSNDSMFKTNLIKVQAYINHGIILSNKNSNRLLLTISNELLTFLENQNKNLYYSDIKLLKGILRDSSPANYLNEINSLKDNNVIKIIWIRISKIFEGLTLQNNTVSLKPYYLKFNEFNSLITIHFSPLIYIFDTHDITYYKVKMNDLYYKFNDIPYNITRNMKDEFEKTKSMGWEGYNRIGACINIIGTDINELDIKLEKIIKQYNLSDTTPVIDVKTTLIDLSNYYKYKSNSPKSFTAINNHFDTLIKNKNILSPLNDENLVDNK